jgi:hypothetical protein
MRPVMTSCIFVPPVTRRHFLAWTGGVIASSGFHCVFAAECFVAPQPYFAGVNRALAALARLGAPVSAADAQRITALSSLGDHTAVEAAEQVLRPYTLARVSIEADGSGHVETGGSQRILVEQGWRMFLVRIANPNGRTDNIMFSSAARGSASMMLPTAAPLNKGPRIAKLWLLSELYMVSPVLLGDEAVRAIELSGIPVEYCVIELFSRGSGHRRDRFTLYTSRKSSPNFHDSGHGNFDFECLPSRTVTLSVRDADGRGCVASLTIRDQQDRVYPPQAMRVAPDLYFQSQIYRADGETMRLPDGEYLVESRRGPEYLDGMQTVNIDASHARIEIKLQRWIDPAQWGWYSGDTHIHAAGCAHYALPTEGVAPETMIRQARGEGLAIAEVLAWASGWYYQKQFFTGHAISPPASLEYSELQVASETTLQPRPTAEDGESSLRYDVEISGFPSSHAGHLVLIRLKDQDYPGTKITEDWPSWNLPILKWVRSQGGLGGYAHGGNGMVVDSTDLPNYEIPPMDGVGTQEAIIDVTHGLVDFLSGCDTNPIAELNAWYHMMNCGFRMAFLGETDYPCLSDERVGAGRSYVRLDHRPANDVGCEAWLRGIEQGRLYCGEGRSHFLDFKVNDHRNGEGDLAFSASGTFGVETVVAARLEPEPPVDRDPLKQGFKGWHLEHARIGTTRSVPVELLINGVAVSNATLVADGEPRTISFRARVVRSSWVALRILPSSHTHPIFVTVDGKPIRASRRSAQWCRACVDKVWEVKSAFIRERERAAAAEAFEYARRAYDKIIDECEVA